MYEVNWGFQCGKGSREGFESYSAVVTEDNLQKENGLVFVLLLTTVIEREESAENRSKRGTARGVSAKCVAQI
jgi:hypothetical protein